MPSSGSRLRGTGLLAWAAAPFAAIALAIVCTVSGLHTGWKVTDADEIVYRQTLVAMQHGQGFYQAQRTALIAKEHQPPTSVRAIRPPTLYEFLALFPSWSWRWLVGLVYVADLLLVWRLARGWGPLRSTLAVILAGVWVWGFSSYLFLHAEVWGMPFFLAGLVSLRPSQHDHARRHRRIWMAALAMLAATSIRELYAIGIGFGALACAGGPIIVWLRNRSAERLRAAWHVFTPWLVAGGVGAALYAVHTVLAAQVLAAHGYNARFENEARTIPYLLSLLAPVFSPAGKLFGVVVTALGILGVVRFARRDPAAFVGGAGALVVLAASIWATRIYWSAVWAIPLAAFAPATAARERLA